MILELAENADTYTPLGPDEERVSDDRYVISFGAGSDPHFTSVQRLRLAEAFQREGNQVIIAGRRKKALDETVAANPGMKAAVLDIDNAEAIRTFAERIKKDYPALNVVILRRSGQIQGYRDHCTSPH